MREYWLLVKACIQKTRFKVKIIVTIEIEMNCGSPNYVCP